ncbi:hypothetical protein C8R45DRAFT_1076664 [Mycena sanguinolenta]|nr:hypothetical protein C8R45DRAFT_1076664 [Mycena sanguinolenta]
MAEPTSKPAPAEAEPHIAAWEMAGRRSNALGSILPVASGRIDMPGITLPGNPALARAAISSLSTRAESRAEPRQHYLKVFWEPLKLRLDWVVTSRSMLFGTCCSDVCGWEGNGVLPTLVPHVSTCLHVTSMVMVQAVLHPTGVYAPTVSSLTEIEPFVDRKEVDHKPKGPKGRRQASGPTVSLTHCSVHMYEVGSNVAGIYGTTCIRKRSNNSRRVCLRDVRQRLLDIRQLSPRDYPRNIYKTSQQFGGVAKEMQWGWTHL